MRGATGVAIGVHVHAEPERLLATMDSLERNTGEAYECLVIPDGADDATRGVLAGLRGVRIVEDVGGRGGAACLNRLRHATTNPIVILLESGCRVAPGWLEALVAALGSSPRAGLAGPSTNRSWNEQRVFADAGEGREDLARTAAEAARRFGKSCRTLAPLFSLADFCYAVRRDVFDAIGQADEAYALGPCWEMDYNIRAARAGFDGLWAGAAYVWRAPITVRQAREEAARFETNKRRYQDKFCGERLEGRSRGYRAHCYGDACTNFAPAHLIKIGPTHRRAAPLVSCIMPTYNRRPFIRLALDRFREQTYANRELIVVDDGPVPVNDLLSQEPAVRYIRVEPRLSIGAKRNLACGEARGEIVAHWDDDDWYAPDRLERQAAPIVSGEADITGLENSFVLQMPDRRFWTVDPGLHRAMFVGDVHGGTLTFRRRLWVDGIRYPEVDLAEDAQWLQQATSRGHRLLKLANRGSFVYTRHSTNAWRFETGSFLDPSGWHQSSAPSGFSAESLDAYAAAASGLAAGEGCCGRPKATAAPRGAFAGLWPFQRMRRPC